jgi:MinD-like ATPase involved in chromosome partitioning or flagellar assembly
MIAQSDLPRQISEHLTRTLRTADPEAQVQIKRTSLGWLHLHVITSSFAGQTLVDRERRIDAILATLNINLGGYPFADYTLLTSEEAADRAPFQPIQLPLWSEILMAPEPDNPVPLDEDSTKRPFIVTFYSFKGGVGRSTALGLVATILATRGHRVVMIDFDLEAPGLSLMLPSDSSNGDKCGVLDYIHQRYLTPDQNQPEISECIRQIDIPTRGELYLVSAGEYNESYIHRLADLDVRLLYQRETNPIHQLLDDVKAYLDPDIILIDARTGFTEMGAIALFDQADLGVICFSPTNQSFAGLQWVVKAASKQRSYRGIPDLRFLLTPMPPVAQSQQQIWVAQVADQACLPFFDQLRLERALPVTRHFDVHMSLLSLQRFLRCPLRIWPVVLPLRACFGDPKCVSSSVSKAAFDHRLGQLFEQSVFSQDVLGSLILFEQFINQFTSNGHTVFLPGAQSTKVIRKVVSCRQKIG